MSWCASESTGHWSFIWNIIRCCNHERKCKNLLTCTLIATVQKIVTEILPPSTGLSFGKDARDLLIEVCVEFITLISSEANEISEEEAKKTIACEHITKALTKLGFDDYVQDIQDVANEHKETLKVRCYRSILRRSFSFPEHQLTWIITGTREESKQAWAEWSVYWGTSCNSRSRVGWSPKSSQLVILLCSGVLTCMDQWRYR